MQLYALVCAVVRPKNKQPVAVFEFDYLSDSHTLLENMRRLTFAFFLGRRSLRIDPRAVQKRPEAIDNVKAEEINPRGERDR